jgi:hypothetical protein
MDSRFLSIHPRAPRLPSSGACSATTSAAQAAASTLLRPIIQHEADIEFAMGIAETGNNLPSNVSIALKYLCLYTIHFSSSLENYE